MARSCACDGRFARTRPPAVGRMTRFSARRPIVFVDRLSVAACVRLLPLWRDSVVWCFEPPPRWVARVLRLLRPIRLAPSELHQVSNTAADVREADGHGAMIALAYRTRSICTRIRQEVFLGDALLYRFGAEWPADRLACYLDRRVEETVRRELVRIALAAWLRDRTDAMAPKALLAIKARPWLSHITADARAARLTLVSYRDPGDMLRGAWKTLRMLGALARSRGTTTSAAPADATAESEPQMRPRVAIKYGHRALSLDPHVRSEFFWLHGLDHRDVEILLYGYPEVASCPAALLRRLAEARIQVTGPPARAPLGQSVRAVWRVCRVALRTPTRRLGYRLDVVRGLIPLALDFARWSAFFRAHHVKVTVTTMMNGSVAETMAVEALGGVATSYQYSIANIAVPTAWLTAGESVQFVNSKVFAEIWRGLGGGAASYICTGLLYQRPPRDPDESDPLRSSLLSAGARFVVCYFDENSIDRWDLFLPHRDAAHDYAVLAQWVLDDPTIAVIAKPKKPGDLKLRIASAIPMVTQAERTGRWRFVTEDGVYPADIARSADVCIGWLGTSATLEARLAGIRSVQIDTLGLSEHPFYEWGRGSVVFDGWVPLARALAAFRADPDANSSFGDWTPALDALDPARDGQATLRMGSYILALWRALRDGADTRTAVERADALVDCSC